MSQRLLAVTERMLGAQKHGATRKRVHYPTYVVRVLLQVVRKWRRDRAPQLAAALSFSTALSIVPFLAAGMALVHASGAIEIEQTLLEFLADQIAPVGRSEVVLHLREWTSNARFSTAGLIGVATLLVLGYITITRAERIFSDIWRSGKKRKMGQRFVVFYALITLVPALFGVSLYVAARSGLTQGPLGWLGALAATCVGFTMVNKLLPTAVVRWRSALAAGLVTALLFELAKFAFSAYVVHVAFARYMGIYGPLALLPILLLWVYYTWLVVLLGAEVAYALQHLPELELYDRRGERVEDDMFTRVNGLVASRFMTAIVAGWRQGRPSTRDLLTRRFDLAPEAAQRVLGRLRDAGLVVEVMFEDEVAYLPGKPPAEVTLADVFAAFRDGDVVRLAARATSNDPLDRTLDRIDRGRQASLAEITLDSLGTASAAPGVEAAPAGTPPRADDKEEEEEEKT
jgi:membrane protein